MLQPFVSLQSNLLLCWHGFCNVSNSMKVDPLCTAEVDSTELADVCADCNVHRGEHNLVKVFAHELTFLKTYTSFMLLSAIIMIQKFNVSKRFLQSFQASKLLYAIIATKHVFLYNNICYRPLGAVKTAAFQARVTTPPSGSSGCQCIENHV